MKEEFRTLNMGDGAVVSYRVRRERQPRPLLVLIHGMASNMTRWSEFVETTSLAESWDLLRLDLRGHALSLYRGTIRMEVWCRDIAAILDAEGYGEAVMMGHCLGANLSLHFASRYPERTAGIILIEPMPREALTGSLRKAQPLRPLMSFLVPLALLLNRIGLYRGSIPSLNLRELDQETRKAMSAQGSADAMLKRYAAPGKDIKYLPSAIYLQEFLQVSAPLPALERIAVPVLALLSTGRFLSDPDITKRVLAALPDCRIVMVDSQHWIPTERPAEMRREIEAWCAAISKRIKTENRR